jgi:DNA-binding transcriptional regulator YhcF (GntR family)
MFDIQHDSPVPIHEQITSQLRVHIATEAMKAGTVLPEYRAFSQELLTNPQVVARAYAELEAEGVLKKESSGAMTVSEKAAVICRLRLQDIARGHIRQSIGLAAAWNLSDAEITNVVEQALVASKAQPLSTDEILQAIKKPAHERSHRASQGIQDLSRQSRPGRP